jgi:hypothetical protein
MLAKVSDAESTDTDPGTTVTERLADGGSLGKSELTSDAVTVAVPNCRPMSESPRTASVEVSDEVNRIRAPLRGEPPEVAVAFARMPARSTTVLSPE